MLLEPLDVLERTGGRIPASDETTFESIQLPHRLAVELEREDVKVFVDARWRDALRECDESLLQTPPQQNLSRRSADAVRNPAQHRIVNLLAARQGTVGFGRNVILAAVVDELCPLEPRVEFDLVDLRSVLGLAVEQFLDVPGVVVAHTTGTNLTGIDRLLDRTPLTESLLWRAVRCMDEVEVDVAKSTITQGVFNSGHCLFIATLSWWQLGGEEDLITG